MSLDTTPVDAGKPAVDASGKTQVVNPSAPVVDTTEAPNNPDLLSAVQKRDQAKAQYRTEKKRADELATELDTIKRADAEKQGQYKELFEKRDEQYKSLYNQWLGAQVKSAVDAAAVKYGCTDTELAFLAGKKDLLEFDETTGRVDGVETFFEELRDRKPLIFQTPKTPTVNPSLPGGLLKVASEGKDYSSMSTQELKAELVRVAKKGA